MALNAILGIFASDQIWLEMRRSLIVQKLCILLYSKIIYIRMVEVLSMHDLTITAGRGTAWNSSQPWSRLSTQSSSIFLEQYSLRVILAQSIIPSDNL